MNVILQVRATGSAEIIVTAGSSSDKHVVISRFLGRTIGDVLRVLQRRGYTLTFVTDKYFVCTRRVRGCRGGQKMAAKSGPLLLGD